MISTFIVRNSLGRNTSSCLFVIRLHFVGEPEIDVVAIDHCYAKPWSAHPDASNAKPAKLLFMAKYPRNQAQERM